MRFRPTHALALVVVLLGGGILLERTLGQGGRYEFVRPDAAGRIEIDLTTVPANQVRWFRFINSGNQEVKFFVGRDANGVAQVGFDASDNDYKMKRGFRAQDGWVINNKCDSSFRLTEINDHPSGCAPVPVKHRLERDRVVLEESALLEGWRYFR